MLFQGGQHGGPEGRLWLAAKTQTTRWTHKPLTGAPNDTAQTPEPEAKAKVPPPCPGVRRQQSRHAQRSEDAEVAHWGLKGKQRGEGRRVEIKARLSEAQLVEPHIPRPRDSPEEEKYVHKNECK